MRFGPKGLAFAIAFAFSLAPAQEGALATPIATAPPTLKTDTAIYQLDQGMLQYAFTFVNPSDSVLFLDCQIPPHASMSGNTLVLTFDRKPASAGSRIPGEASQGGGGGHGVSSTGAGVPSGPASSGTTAGGPASGIAVDPNDFPPQRIGAHQTFQGQRRLDRVLGDFHARPRFAKVQLRMAYYPERVEGEGTPFVVERERRASAAAVNVVRKGKAPPPPKVRKFRVPKEGAPPPAPAE
ncbi:MAG: hypothetical protein JWP91_1436 [Fibrobacteres bacterium]|nr:hypothetical protein [Fibrobacterota bacterium]